MHIQFLSKEGTTREVQESYWVILANTDSLKAQYGNTQNIKINIKQFIHIDRLNFSFYIPQKNEKNSVLSWLSRKINLNNIRRSKLEQSLQICFNKSKGNQQREKCGKQELTLSYSHKLYNSDSKSIDQNCKLGCGKQRSKLVKILMLAPLICIGKGEMMRHERHCLSYLGKFYQICKTKISHAYGLSCHRLSELAEQGSP